MSSPRKSASASAALGRAERFKKELVEFATEGPLRDEFELQRSLFFENSNGGDEHEAESVLDWFLFDWFDDYGNGVIDYFLEERSGLREADQQMLLDWQDSINSVFEVRAAKKNTLELRELDGKDLYTVRTAADQTFKRGQFIIARLLPLGNELIFSGLQFLMPDRESALAWLEMRRAFDAFDSPEAVEKTRRDQISAFRDLFGCDELTVSSSKLNSTLERFQRYLLTERRDPETGMTPAERFQKELGQQLSLPDPQPLPEPVAGAGEVTILCDDFDGIVLLPEFTRFRRIFETEEPDRHTPDWKDLVWTYVKNPDIPIVAFERVAEQYPLRVEKVLRNLIGDKDFSLEHLYAVLLHYKEPVDGLEDLKDDQQLWDLFNGNSHAAPVSKRPRRKPKAKPAKAPKRTTSKSAKVSTLRRAEKKPGAKRKAKKAQPARAKSKQPAKRRAAAKAQSRKRSSSKKR